MRRLALLACLMTVCITAASAFIRNWQAQADCVGARCPSPAAVEGRGASREPAGAGADRQHAAGAADTGTDRAATASIGDAQATPMPVMVARLAHRIAAMVVGLLAILLTLIAWSRPGHGERAASVVALAFTLGLSWLGRHTPSEVPMVTLGNVLGGFLLVAAFAWIAAGPTPGPGALRGIPAPAGDRARGGSLALSLVLLLAVTAVGVMIGARDAVGACALPICTPGELPRAAAFDPRVAGAFADRAAQQWLHLVHRGLALVLAVIVVVVTALVAWRTRQSGGVRDRVLLFAVVGGMFVQAALGAAIAGGAVSATTSAMHNAVAALLVAALAAASRRAMPLLGRTRWRSS